jgi:thiamine biosynthesis protein ThiS
MRFARCANIPYPAEPMSEEPAAIGKISLFVNGRARQMKGSMTVAELAAECRLDPRRLLVELNGRTLGREEWAARVVEHGDRVEFIRVVAGG